MSSEKPPKVDPSYPSGDGLSSAGEAAIGTLGAAAGLAVPVVGPAVVQALIRKVVQTPLEQRRARWFGSLGAGLRELQDRLDGFDPSELNENEEFVSAVAETTRIAITTHRREKLEALRNVVLNVAAGVRLDDVLQKTFLGYVDRFSDLHLKVLQIFTNPAAVPAITTRAENMMAGALIHILPLGVPEANGSEELLERVVSDLARESLIDGSGLHTMMTASGLTAKRTTPIGDAFLRYISDPLSH